LISSARYVGLAGSRLGGQSRPPETKIFSHQCGGHLQPGGGLKPPTPDKSNTGDYKAPSTGGGLGVDSFCFSSGDIAVNTKFRDDRDPFGFATVFTISATFASVSGLRLRNDPCVIFCNNYTNTTQKYSHTTLGLKMKYYLAY